MQKFEVKDHEPSFLPEGNWKLVWADEFDGTELDVAALRDAVDALPAGRLAEQLGEGRELRVKFGMDPTSADMMGTVYACEALRMADKGGRKYNRAYRKGLFGQKK